MPTLETLVHDLGAFEHHTPPHLSLTHGEELEGFHDIVAEPAIERSFDGLAFGLILLRETVCQMLANQLLAISD